MTTPVYLQIQNFADALDTLDVLKTRLIESKRLLKELHAIRAAENKELHDITINIEEMENKLLNLEAETTIE